MPTIAPEIIVKNRRFVTGRKRNESVSPVARQEALWGHRNPAESDLRRHGEKRPGRLKVVQGFNVNQNRLPDPIWDSKPTSPPSI